MYSANAPAAKRQRTESSASQQPKRGEPWFDDGNIVLQAELTQFRVYRGVLAASSDIFADMLSLPQPTVKPGNIIVEGCPVVVLADSADDWHHVLKALFLRRSV
jgi:hypothetical protein